MEHSSDLEHLRRSIELADEAVREGNHPFGAVLVSAAGTVLMEGKNSHSVDGGPGHAEANLARDAARAFDIATLRGATLFTSVEPCSMCAGALFWSQIGRIVIGAEDSKRGFRTFGGQLHPKTEVEYGLMANACSNILLDYFRAKRKKK